jgi:hypothetical protein
LTACGQGGLLDLEMLKQLRTLDREGKTICPLCLLELSSQGFFERMTQAEGREVHDLTITQINLFHIEELRYGIINHRPYNVAWGHHHCDMEALRWMRDVVERNIADGHLPISINGGS